MPPLAITSDPKFGDCSVRTIRLHHEALVVEFQHDNTRETTSITFRNVRFFQIGSDASNLILDRIDHYDGLHTTYSIPTIKRIVCDEENLSLSARTTIERSKSGVYHLVPLAGCDGIVICDSAERAAWSPPGN